MSRERPKKSVIESCIKIGFSSRGCKEGDAKSVSLGHSLCLSFFSLFGIAGTPVTPPLLTNPESIEKSNAVHLTPCLLAQKVLLGHHITQNPVSCFLDIRVCDILCSRGIFLAGHVATFIPC